MCSKELLRLRPQGRYAIRCIIEVDGETVGFVVILHPAENIVVNIAEEVDFRFHAPVISDIFKGGMLVEHATVPAAHLVVGYHWAILDLLLLEHLGGFVEEVAIDPLRDSPVFVWYFLYSRRQLVLLDD